MDGDEDVRAMYCVVVGITVEVVSLFHQTAVVLQVRKVNLEDNRVLL